MSVLQSHQLRQIPAFRTDYRIMVAATGIQSSGTRYDQETSLPLISLARARIEVATASLAGKVIIRSHVCRRLTSFEPAEDSTTRGEGGTLAICDKGQTGTIGLSRSRVVLICIIID